MAQVGQQARESVFVGIGIQAQALRRNASDGADSGSFEDHEPRARDGETAEVHPMPWLRRTIDGTVLAQGRDYNTICERQIAKLNGRKKCAGHEDNVAIIRQRLRARQ